MSKKLYNILNKNIKEFNIPLLLTMCVLFLLLVGFISYKINNPSYALFTNTVNGTKTLTFHYVEEKTLFKKEFEYTGEEETYKVKKTGYYYIEMAGAEGGNSGYLGSKTSGYIKLDAGEKLYFYVGKKGTNSSTNCRSEGYEFNGGGIAKPSNGKCGATGGGATDVRLVSGDWDNNSSLISRIMVAGAGGGSFVSNSYANGSGGTLYGEKPMEVKASQQSYQGNPGTQISGGLIPSRHSCASTETTAGSFGKGGFGGANQATTQNGGGSGGGAGYYGGSGSSGLCEGTWAGGGGSSYISGYAGVNSVEENATTITHTNQTLHYSGKYFIGGDMIAGQNSGNGYAKIEYVGEKPERQTNKLNNVRYIKDCSSYNTTNSNNHWTEIQAIKDGLNIAKDKNVVGNEEQNNSYPYSRITDGDITMTSYATSSSWSQNQCVTIDLGKTYNLDEVAVWNYFGDQRRYLDNDVMVSSDNSAWINLSEDEVWRETSNGARWNAYTNHINGYKGREAIRLWYDGFANTGTNRNLTTTLWKNLMTTTTNTALDGSILSGTDTASTWGVKYLQLDGTDDYVKIAQMNYEKPTIEVVFSSSSIRNSHIVSNAQSGGYFLKTDSSGIVKSGFHIGGYYYLSSLNAITAGSIYQYATTYDEQTRKLYKSGTTEESNSGVQGSIDIPDYNTVMAIGTNPYANHSEADFFQGKIYSVRIYDGALTDEQIYHNYLYDKQLFNLD